MKIKATAIGILTFAFVMLCACQSTDDIVINADTLSAATSQSSATIKTETTIKQTATQTTITETSLTSEFGNDMDNDDDGLSDSEEYEYNTDPFSSDTDWDDLSDYDEINEYKTDPLKCDTDGDKIWDSDEFIIGLDPLNPETFGYPDADYVYEQKLLVDDLPQINMLNDLFTVELDITAGNNVKRHIIEGESGYNNVISDNTALLDNTIIINYDAGKIESGTIKFTIDEDYLETNKPYYPELNSGLERYGVFIFDEELNILVPIEAEYAGNTISVDIKYFGNLCIMDLEEMLYNLGYVFEEE